MANSLLLSLVSLLSKVTWPEAVKFTALAMSAAVIGHAAEQIPDVAAYVGSTCSTEQIKKNNEVKADLSVDRIDTPSLRNIWQQAKDHQIRSDVNCFQETYSVASGRLYARYRAEGRLDSETEPLREACVKYARNEAWAAKCGQTGSAIESPSAPLPRFAALNTPREASHRPAPRTNAGKRKAIASSRSRKAPAGQPSITYNIYIVKPQSSVPSASPSPSAASDGGAKMADSALDVSSNLVGQR